MADRLGFTGTDPGLMEFVASGSGEFTAWAVQSLGFTA